MPRIYILILLLLSSCSRTKQDNTSSPKDIYDRVPRESHPGYYLWIEGGKVYRTICLEDRSVWTRANCPLFKKSMDSKVLFDKLMQPRQIELNEILDRRGDILQRFVQVSNKIEDLISADDDASANEQVKALKAKKQKLLADLQPYDLKIGDLENQIRELNDDYTSSGNLELFKQLAEMKEKLEKVKKQSQDLRSQLAETNDQIYSKSSQVIDSDIIRQLVAERRQLATALEDVQKKLNESDMRLNAVYRVYRLLQDSSFTYKLESSGGNPQSYFDEKALEEIEDKFTEFHQNDQILEMNWFPLETFCKEGVDCKFKGHGGWIFDKDDHKFPVSTKHKGTLQCKLLDVSSARCHKIKIQQEASGYDRFVMEKNFDFNSGQAVQVNCDDWSKPACASKLSAEGYKMAFYDNRNEELGPSRWQQPYFLERGLIGGWKLDIICDYKQPFKPKFECTFEVEE